MWPYWLLFVIPAAGVLSRTRLDPRSQRIVWFFVGVAFAIAIGLRHKVGGDWRNYARQLELVQYMTFDEVVRIDDPAYYVINWLALDVGLGIYFINFVCASIVMFGVVLFARRQPLPWLALLVAVPYLIVVVAMGYTRQSVALGLCLVGLESLGRQRTLQFVIWVFLGALFHKSAVLLLPVAALAASRRRLWTYSWIALTSVLGAILLVQDSGQALWTRYVEESMESQGGEIRVAMNALPAVLYLLFQRRFNLDRTERLLWLWMSIFSLACVPLVFVASTAVDRIALYFIPVQMFVFARLPGSAGSNRGRTDLAIAVMAYYALVLWVWLNFATHAIYWLPYEFMPL